MFYHQTDFDLSSKSKKWLIGLTKSKWANEFPHDTEYTLLGSIWPISPVGKEIALFLKQYGLNANYCGVNLFMSNNNDQRRTNPHVDILHRGEHFLPIKTRFNILVLGNQSDPMYWWDSIYWGSGKLVEKEFTYSGSPYTSLAVPGETIEERWKYLGEPSAVKKDLLVSSAFVNTEFTHALDLSPGPRLVVSVAFEQTIQSIIN